jgi:hypothetical protein
VTGFPPGIVTGTIYIGPGPAETAQGQLTTAFNTAAGYPVGGPGCGGTLTGGENLAGLTLTPGVWTSGSTLYITGGTLYLNGPGIYIFQVASALTVDSGGTVLLEGGAQAADVFWVIGSSASFGTTSSMQGTVMTYASITMLSGATLVGRTLAETGEVSYSSSSVVVPTPVATANYAVTFTETGLPTGTNWSVTLNGVLNTSTTSTIGFTVGNGTYAYSVGTVAHYSALPASGSLTVNGAAVSRAITFTAGLPTTYAITFTESGLPSATNWSVTLNGVRNTSTTSTIGFAPVNGTYNYEVGAVTGYTMTPSVGTVTVHGAPIHQTITFRAGVVETFAVTFAETGLPSGTSWTMTLNGQPGVSTSSAITFDEPNGTYAYSVGAVAHYTASPLFGNVTVNGQAVLAPITFVAGAPATFPVTFTESGLAAGTNWSLTVNSVPMNSTTSVIVYSEANGTYLFTVGDVAGYSAIPLSGSVTVNGTAVREVIAFTAGVPVTLAVTFTESGLASGAKWSAALNGVLSSSTTTTISFHVVNGTYAYSIGTQAGYTATPSSGTETVRGLPVDQAISFSASPLTVTVITSPSTGITVLSLVTFTVLVTPQGLAPGGTATLYIGSDAGIIHAEWVLPIVAGTDSILLIPGQSLAAGASSVTFWSTFSGVSSAIGVLTFESVVAPTTLALSTTPTGPGFTMFSIASDGSDVTVLLMAYSPSGVLIAEYTVGLTVGANGQGTIVLNLSMLGSTAMTWVASYGSVISNSVVTAG